MANDTIGSLTAVVRATSAQFAQDMKQVEGSLDELKSHAQSIDFKEALGIGAAVELFHEGIELAKETLEGFFETITKGAELQKLAETIGSTTEELSGLRYAAHQTDVTTEELDVALKKMEKTLGEAQAGSKEAAAALHTLNLTARELQGLSAGQTFERIADAIKALGNPADEAAAAIHIFGKSAAEIIPLLAQGSAGIEDLRAKARQMGLELGGEGVQSLTDAQHALNELGDAWEGFKTQLAIEVAPALRVIANMMRDMSISAKENATGIAETALHWAELAAEIGAAIVIIPEVIEIVGALQEALEALAAGEATVEALTNPAALAAGLLAAAAAVAVIHTQFSAFKEKVAAAAEEAKKEAAAAKQQAEAKRSLVLATTEAQKKFEEYNKELKEAHKLLEESLTPLEKFHEKLAELQKLLADKALTQAEFLKIAKHDADEATKALERTHKQMQELHESQSSAGLDVRTTAGVTAELSADRFARDLQQHNQEVEKDQLEQQKLAAGFLQEIRNALTAGGDGAAVSGAAELIADF